MTVPVNNALVPTLEELAEQARRVAEEQRRLELYVRRARKGGASWAAIGAVFGITRQAAQQRFGQ